MASDKHTKPRIIAVDGPAGSGKSSICSSVAKKMGWAYLNTGAIYRGLAALAKRRDIVLEDHLNELAKEFCKEARWEGTAQKLFYGNEDLTPELTTPATTALASKIAKISSLRKTLLPLQREWALKAKTVCLVDGRDIGTVVFPDADLKVFMTASLEERARRRIFQSLKGSNSKIKDLPSIPIEQVTEMMHEISLRDEQDSSRGAAPLKRADDAKLFDNTGLSEEQSVQEFVKLLESIDFLSKSL